MSTDAKPCAIIVMGVSGAGKTTIAKALAERLRWSFEDGDAFHPAANVKKMESGTPLTDSDREPWLRAIADRIAERCEGGAPIIIACSALKRSYRGILLARRSDVRFVYLQGDKSLIAERLAARNDHFMPAGLLHSQFATLEEPDDDEPAITVSIHAAPEAVVAEIVGALEAEQR